MKLNYLSYIMGASKITETDLTGINVDIVARMPDGDYKVKVSQDFLPEYINLISRKLDPEFWNDLVSINEIIFLFKFKDGTFKKLILSDESKDEISNLCHLFSGEPIEKTTNILKFMAENEYYKEFIEKNYLKQS